MIAPWACAQLEGRAVDDLDGNLDSLRGYRSLTHGEKPLIIPAASLQEDVRHVREMLKSGAEQGIEARKVCVAMRDNGSVDDMVSALASEGIACLKLSSNATDDPATPGVRLATMHRIKGLEFDVVIVAGYEGADVYAQRFSKDEDAGVTEDTATAERCLLHVAATRAKRQLIVLQRAI